MPRLYNLLILICPIILWSCSDNATNEYISQLDQEITLKDNYDKIKIDRINYIKSLLSHATSSDELIHLHWELINEYRTYQGDSAEIYSIRLIDLGENIGSKKAIALGQVGLMDSFTAVGYFKEANEVLQQIQIEDLPEDIKPFFLDLAYRLHENMESFVFDSGSGLKDKYRKKRFDYLKELIENTNPNTYERDAAQIELNKLSGQPLEEIIRQREVLLKRYKPNEHDMAIQNSKMAISAMDLGKTEEAKEYMAKAAIADIKYSTKETTAAKTLAQIMDEEGDSKHATEYIHLALDDAEFFGSQLRKVEIGAILPSIENTRYSIKSSQHAFAVVALAIALAFIVISCILFFVLKQRNQKLIESNDKLDQSHRELSQRNEELLNLQKELNEILNQLKETTELKDEYIMQSLSVNADFVNSIEEKTKKIARQIREKNYDELKFVEHQLGIKEERQRIYKSFDSAFRKLFPNFVEEINRLLPAEDRFETREDDDFPVDLRIFALIRLGISDPAEIARYLNLSVKTVYVYKTRLKTKSLVDNNEFEARVMSIPKP